MKAARTIAKTVACIGASSEERPIILIHSNMRGVEKIVLKPSCFNGDCRPEQGRTEETSQAASGVTSMNHRPASAKEIYPGSISADLRLLALTASNGSLMVGIFFTPPTSEFLIEGMEFSASSLLSLAQA